MTVGEFGSGNTFGTNRNPQARWDAIKDELTYPYNAQEIKDVTPKKLQIEDMRKADEK